MEQRNVFKHERLQPSFLHLQILTKLPSKKVEVRGATGFRSSTCIQSLEVAIPTRCHDLGLPFLGGIVLLLSIQSENMPLAWESQSMPGLEIL